MVHRFKVKVTEREVVSAALPLQDHWLPLSNLDLLLPPVDVGVFFCYNKGTSSSPTSIESVMSFRSMVGVLKKALAQALVSFYAFAGELVKNAEGEPELHCNNGGVDFVMASANVELSVLDLYNPDDSVEGKLVPAKKRGVLAVQVIIIFFLGLKSLMVKHTTTYNAFTKKAIFFLMKKIKNASYPISPSLIENFTQSNN